MIREVPISSVAFAIALWGVAVAGGGMLLLDTAGAPTDWRLIAYLCGLGAAIAGGPLLYIRWQVHGPVARLRQTIEAMQRDGDLSHRAPVLREDGIGATARAFNQLIENLQSIIGQVCYNSGQVAKTSSVLMGEARQLAGGSETQRQGAESAARALDGLNAGIDQVARHTEHTERNARAALDLSRQGAGIVDRASGEIQRIALSVEQSAAVIVALGERAQSIGVTLGIIDEIADQTNLLAMNAAIEAARAGDSGFGIVADEVRKLAERTSAATVEIARVIAAIQAETKAAVANVQAGSEQARSGAELARQAAAALQKISGGAQETMEMVAAIVQLLSEQSKSGQEISGHMQDILRLAGNNSSGATRTFREASQLDALSANISQIGNVFKFGLSGERAMAIHAKLPEIVRQAAKEAGRILDQALQDSTICLEDLFDTTYEPIPQTKPQKFHTRFDALTDRIMPPLQDKLVDLHGELVYAICCDTNGYVPTHNSRFSKPLTGNEKVDFVNNRTKRVFDDAVGKKCGAHEQPYLLQTYRRDTGEIMHDISAPIYVGKRHWGGFRIGYWTE